MKLSWAPFGCSRDATVLGTESAAKVRIPVSWCLAIMRLSCLDEEQLRDISPTHPCIEELDLCRQSRSICLRTRDFAFSGPSSSSSLVRSYGIQVSRFPPCPKECDLQGQQPPLLLTRWQRTLSDWRRLRSCDREQTFSKVLD